MAVTGRTQAKKAKKKAAYLRRVSEFQKRSNMLKEARTVFAQSTTAINSGVTGAGAESSGGQGVLASLNSQAGYNLALDRHVGEVNNQINAHVRSAKKAASNIQMAAIAATVVTLGVAGVAGVAAAGAASSAGATATAGAAGAAAGSVGSTGFLAAGAGAAKASFAATAGIRAGAKAISSLATNYDADPGAIGDVSIAPPSGSFIGGSGSGRVPGQGFTSGTNYQDNRFSSPRNNVNSSVFLS